jgi:hypothetical protein
LGQRVIHKPREASQDKTKILISVDPGQVVDEEVVLTNILLGGLQIFNSISTKQCNQSSHTSALALEFGKPS